MVFILLSVGIVLSTPRCEDPGLEEIEAITRIKNPGEYFDQRFKRVYELPRNSDAVLSYMTLMAVQNPVYLMNEKYFGQFTRVVRDFTPEIEAMIRNKSISDYRMLSSIERSLAVLNDPTKISTLDALTEVEGKGDDFSRTRNAARASIVRIEVGRVMGAASSSDESQLESAWNSLFERLRTTEFEKGKKTLHENMRWGIRADFRDLFEKYHKNLSNAFLQRHLNDLHYLCEKNYATSGVVYRLGEIGDADSIVALRKLERQTEDDGLKGSISGKGVQILDSLRRPVKYRGAIGKIEDRLNAAQPKK